MIKAARTAYTVRYATAIYVLHVFQKKSKHGAPRSRRSPRWMCCKPVSVSLDRLVEFLTILRGARTGRMSVVMKKDSASAA